MLKRTLLMIAGVLMVLGVPNVFGTFLFSGTMALAGSPYNLAVPAPGLKFQPHVAQPVIKVKPTNRHPVLTTQPTIRRSTRVITPVFPYTAMTQSRARRQGKISAGGVRWSCKGARCTTSASWARPTVQTCKALAGVVGAIQSYGKRGVGLNAMDIRRCNAGIAVAKSKRKRGTAFNRGFAARAPIHAPHAPVRGITGLSHTPSAIHAPQVHGGFVPSISSRTKMPNLNIPGVGQAGSPFRGKEGFVPPVHMGPQPPDVVDTGQLSLISKTQIPDIVPTGPLILKAK